MSVSLSVKNIPDEVAERLRIRAKRNRRSLQGELMDILEAAANEDRPDAARSYGIQNGRSLEDSLRNLRELFPDVAPRNVSSTDLIRQMRDSRQVNIGADADKQPGAV